MYKNSMTKPTKTVRNGKTERERARKNNRGNGYDQSTTFMQISK
jgi:hypothetical protein